MDDKPKRRWYQFSLRRMFLATACFAAFFGLWVGLPQITMMGSGPLTMLNWWLLGASIGAGIGSLLGRFWIGLLIGAASALPIWCASWLF
jgi:hypothetical protein